MDEEKESPPLTRKEIRRQRKLDREAEQIRLRNQQKRRLILKAGGIGLLGAVATGLGLTQLLGRRQAIDAESPKIPILPSNKSVDRGYFPRETVQYFISQLIAFDSEIRNNPNKFQELAPKIGDLAAEYFSSQMGYDKMRYQGKMHFLSEEEFRSRVSNNPDCIDTNPDDNTLASIFIESQDINFNLTRIFAKSIPKSGQDHPATALFSVALHELHHHSSPVITISNSPYKLKGVLFLEPNKDGFSCPEGIRMELEEAIVQDSTERMLNNLGLSMNASSQYKKWVRLYREGVIDKLFGGDHKQLLMLHQQTRQDDFFTLIGQRLNYPSPQTRQAGEEYLRTVLLEGI